MKLGVTLLALGFCSMPLVTGSFTLVRARTAIAALGEHISHIQEILRAFHAPFANDTGPMELYVAAAGLHSVLATATDALQAHGHFSHDDGNTIFRAVQEIEPVINELADNIWMKRASFPRLFRTVFTAISNSTVGDVTGVPVAVVNDLNMLGIASRRFQHALGMTQKKGTESYAQVFSRAVQKYHEVLLSPGDPVHICYWCHDCDT
ncbi:hypothetical protein C8J57DRAFT_1234217 [Mycena rebaudengoi]|nr:hypothetical protein C8J57DRAFT_1234217 [Mycena rebaudengoi]